MTTPLRAAGATAAALLLAALPARAQQPGETVTVTPGPQYEAGSTARRLLGSDYRDLWTTPLRVPVLDPDTLGGLRVLGRGGGNQTYSLHLVDGQGREFRFRSVGKWPGRGLNPALRGSVAHDVLQDQVSSIHPGATLLAAPLVRAVGALNVEPRLYVMPDHAFLGALRGEFAGVLGTFEAHPTEKADDPRLREADDSDSTEDLLDKLRSGRDRVDARDYLRGRLLDLVIGDWDRHEDQYRWARFDGDDGIRTWRAIPRDRDYAFVDYDGVLMSVVRKGLAKAVRFGPEIGPSLEGLLENPMYLDRRMLGGLSREAWEAETAEVVRRLSDGVIDEALAQGPPEWRGAAPELAATLRSRRASLPAASAAFYARIAGEAELHGTDEDDVAEVERRPDGAVEVRLRLADGRVLERRVFTPDETREVRVFLYDGDDRGIVRGTGSGIGVRLDGGDDDDVLADSARGGTTVFHDDDGDNVFHRGPGTRVDTRSWTPPVYVRGEGGIPPRDWGSTFTWVSPSGGWRRHAGVVVSAGPQYTLHGFRRHPWAARHALRLWYAPLHTRFALEYEGAVRRTSTDRLTLLSARAGNLQAVSFYGFGNDSQRTSDDNDARLWSRSAAVDVALSVPVADGIRATFGPAARWTDPELRDDTPAGTVRPLGSETYFLGGAVGSLVADRRNSRGFPTRGWRAEVEVDAWPLTDGVDGAFGGVGGSASTYLRLGWPVLAVRAGGRQVFGEFPVQHGAHLGGRGDLRGFRTERFTGDGAVFGQAELRARLFPLQLVVNGDLGVFGLADAGRVWRDGDSPGDWHTAVGGGVFFALLDGNHTVTVAAARGETTRLYFWMGVPF